MAAIFPAFAVTWYAVPGLWQLWTENPNVAEVMMAPPNVHLWDALGFSLAHFTVDGMVMALMPKTYISRISRMAM